MKLARHEIYMLAIATLAFGCSDGFRTGCDSGIREARRAIEAIDVSRQSSAKSFHESVLKACLQIRTCADARVRSELLNSLADRMLSADLRGRTYYGREQMLGNYWRPFTSIGLAMIEADVPDAEILAFFVKGWRKYRDMCYSAGDANDLSDGNGDMARRRRDAARCMRGHYENDIRFFERNALRYMLEGAGLDKPRQAEFLADWHRAFGSQDSVTGKTSVPDGSRENRNKPAAP